MNFFLSRYVSNFNSNTQGVEVMLTHTVKVQFLNPHEQFRNDKAFTIMASKIGKVMEIKPVESYVKRPAGLMLMVEIQNISRLVGHICIFSIVESATPKDTILQKFMYYGLPNQCMKCHQFGHFARACTISKTPILNGSTLASKLQPGTKEWQEVLNPCLLAKPSLPSKTLEES